MFVIFFYFSKSRKFVESLLSYHNVDSNNWFFPKLFQIKNNKSILKQCVRCSEFLTTEKHKSIHNFLKHYEEGKSVPFEEKTIDIVKFHGLTIYSIEFQKHKDLYDFFNSEKGVDDFLKNVENKFISGGKKWIKCLFTIENIQSSPYKDIRPFINNRYWTTSPYEGIYFNDFIFYCLRQNILGRVVINGISDSSWYFKRFVSLSLKILDNDVEAVI